MFSKTFLKTDQEGGGNGLVLLMEVVTDNLPPQDALHKQTQTLHNKLSQINWADYNRLADVPENENGRLRQNFLNNVHRTCMVGGSNLFAVWLGAVSRSTLAKR